VTRTRRTRNTAARRAVHLIWPPLVHRARSVTVRPRVASPRRRRRAKERPSTGRSAMTRPRCRCRRHRCPWPASRRPETERRKKRMPSATVPTWQQRRYVPKTIGTPSWTAFLDPDQTIRRKGWLNDGKIRRQASSTMKPSAPVPFGFVFNRPMRGILLSNPARRPFDKAHSRVSRRAIQGPPRTLPELCRAGKAQLRRRRFYWCTMRILSPQAAAVTPTCA